MCVCVCVCTCDSGKGEARKGGGRKRGRKRVEALTVFGHAESDCEGRIIVKVKLAHLCMNIGRDLQIHLLLGTAVHAAVERVDEEHCSHGQATLVGGQVLGGTQLENTLVSFDGSVNDEGAEGARGRWGTWGTRSRWGSG